MRHSATLHSQRGITLFVGLVMLVLLTLLAVSAIRLSTINKLIVGNEQYQTEAEDAASYELDRIISSSDFLAVDLDTNRPLSAFQTVGSSEPGTLTDGNSYNVTIPTPVCRRYRYIKNSELIDSTGYPTSKANAACIGVTGDEIMLVTGSATSGNSLCAVALWELAANVEVAGTGANVSVQQGIEMRLKFTEAKDLCE